MSTTYTDYRVIDYTNSEVLSTYTLSATPLLFVPDLDDTYSTRVIWDFGDGTISKSFSATKVYDYPGEYKVNLVVYDCDSNALISNFEKTVTVYDYLPYTFNIEYFDYLVAENLEPILTETGEMIYVLAPLNLKCGKIVGPLIFTASFPPYQPTSPIFYSTSGSNSEDYWNININKFSHLENFHTLYDTIFNYTLSSYQYREIDRVSFSSVPIYLKVSSGALISCLSSDAGACFAGLSATKDIYIKDDSISPLVLTKFWFDRTNSVAVKYSNNLGITLSSQVVDNDEVDHLSVTSNGLDGEGYTVDSFNIGTIKYFDTKIPFVIKIKDVDDFSVKNFDKITLSSLNIVLNGFGDVKLTTEGGSYLLDELGRYIYAEGAQFNLGNNEYSVYSLNDTISSQDSGGAFRGYITFPYLSTNDLLQNVFISVSGTFINDQLSSYSISGTSNYFNVYTPNYFDLWKKNEDFNPEQTLKDLRFQETLLDKEVLFGDFLGSLLGDESSDHEAIGVSSYEKIANFVKNTQDLDVSELEFLDSLGEFLGYDDTGDEKYQYPEKIKRLMNLASVGKSQLVGTSNKFRENFDIKGRSSKDEYGVNIGAQINPQTYIVHSNIPIVALEKFGNQYTLINTYRAGIPLYNLYNYSEDWGWPLVLPTPFNFDDIEKYYLFFEYNSQIDNTTVGGIIDFNNSKTTVSPGETGLFGDGEVFENMILNALYVALSTQ